MTRIFISISLAIVSVMLLSSPAPAQTAPATQPAKTQAELEADLANMLSGATLDGSFNSTGPGADPQKIMADKYTLGDVHKGDGNTWIFNAKMNFHGTELSIPLALTVQWAGDTPVLIVNDLTIPGMGTFSARVMFFAGHYSGYWQHGQHGGNMFGIIRPAGAAPTTAPTTGKSF